MATRASGHAEGLAAIALIEPHAERPHPITLGGDKNYDTNDFVTELREPGRHAPCRAERHQPPFGD